MTCPKCERELEGYRCPDCGIFLLDDPSLKGKNKSLYHSEIAKESRKMLPLYIFLFTFVGAWLVVVSYFLTR